MSVTNRGTGWEMRNSLWLVWPLVFHLAFISFFWIGIRAKKTSWIIWGVAYLIVWIVCFAYLLFLGTKMAVDVLTETAPAGGSDNLIFLLGLALIFGWIIPFIQLIVLRREYLVRRDALLTKQAYDEVRYRNEVIQASMQKDVRPADPVPPTDAPPEKTDLNACTEQQLSALPGVSVAMAKRAIEMRKESGGFVSVADFNERLGLAPHFAVQIESLACAHPAAEAASILDGGRVLDV